MNVVTCLTINQNQGTNMTRTKHFQLAAHSEDSDRVSENTLKSGHIILVNFHKYNLLPIIVLNLRSSFTKS